MMQRKRPGIFGLLILLTFAAAAGSAGATETLAHVMSAPPSPEADFTPENTHGFDVSVGYGRIWTDVLLEASLDGFVIGTVYRGTIGRRFGYTLVPVYGGMFFGEVAGFKADALSVGSGLTFASRVVGKPKGCNIILLGSGLYSYGRNTQDDFQTVLTGPLTTEAHFFGFTAGVKAQIAFHRFVRLIPFYLYMGGGGTGTTSTDTIVSTLEASASTGYLDAHLLGLDFNVFGLTAKLIADLFRDDYKSFTIQIDVLGTVRGVKSASAKLKERKANEAAAAEAAAAQSGG